MKDLKSIFSSLSAYGRAQTTLKELKKHKESLLAELERTEKAIASTEELVKTLKNN